MTMRRREFIALVVGGGVAGWCVGAAGRQSYTA